MLTEDKVTVLSKLADVWDKFLGSVSRVSWLAILKLIVFIILLMAVVSFFVTLNDENTRKIISKTITEDRNILNKKDDYVYDLTDDVENSVNDEIEKLRLSLNADRVVVSIFHDNLKTTTGLHFRFFSECYEKVCYDRGIPEIAQNYQGVRTSLHPMVTYLSRHKIVVANVEEMEKIDKRYAHSMMVEDSYLSGLYFLRSESGKEIGILVVSWTVDNKKLVPSKNAIEQNLTKYGVKLESLLDLGYYKEKGELGGEDGDGKAKVEDLDE